MSAVGLPKTSDVIIPSAVERIQRRRATSPVSRVESSGGEGEGRRTVSRKTRFWFSILLVVAAWPTWRMAPAGGLDASWNTGLVLAHINGLRFGPDIAYTYGPLGYLWVPSTISLSSLVEGFLYAILGCGCLVYATVAACSRRFEGWAALAVAAVVAVAAPLEDFAPELYSVALVLLAFLVAQGEVSIPPRVFVVAAGLAAALQTLVKPTAGAVALIAVAIAATGQGSKLRNAATGALGFVAGFLVLWLLASQRLTDIPSWVHVAVNLSLGYADAMAIEQTGRSFEYLVIAILIGWVVIYALRNVRAVPDRRSSILRLMLGALASWIVLKEAFVRHDLHSALAFYTVSLMALALQPRIPRRPALAGLLAASTVMTAVALTVTLPTLIDPTASVQSFFSAVTTTARSGERARMNTVAQTTLEASYQVPDAFLTRIGGSSVHVDPTEISLAWAYGLNWKPVPVFQRFAAYTPYADSLNARALAGGDAPAYVLRQNEAAIDGRNEVWDSPRYMLALLCNYSQVGATTEWQLLARGKDRCSSPRPISTVVAASGETVPIPAPRSPHSIEVVTIQSHLSFLQRLEALLSKPFGTRTVDADGIPYRVTQATTSGPMIVHMPPGVWAPAFDGATSYQTLRSSFPATYVFRDLEVGRQGHR